MRINLILAVFNLIPGFPLDGGRVLRAVVWRATQSFQRATQIAVFSGQIVAFGFIGVGVLTMLGGSLFNGLWLVFIGWFLQNAAAATYAQAGMKDQLQGVRVEQLMTSESPRVSGRISLQQLVDEQILHNGQRWFLVVDDDHLVGMLGLRDVTAIPKESWDRTKVEEVMVPWEKVLRVSSETELLAALQLMDGRQVAQLPVVEGDRVMGVLSRERVLHYIRTRSELGT